MPTTAASNDRVIAGVAEAARLTQLDLCDVIHCPAAAQAVIVFEQGTLIMCAHHTNKNELALGDQGGTIIRKRV